MEVLGRTDTVVLDKTTLTLGNPVFVRWSQNAGNRGRLWKQPPLSNVTRSTLWPGP
jgi:cation transport ATPase